MPQVVIVSSLGPQGPVGPQGLQGLTGSMAESNSGSFAITGSLTVSGSSTFTNIGPAVFSGSSNFTSLTASSALISGNVTVLGTASINTLIVNQTQLSTGSNQLGDAANDTQTLYGTVRIPTGSLTVSGSSYFTGSLSLGTGTVLYGDTANSSLILDQTTGAYLKYGTTSDIGLLGSITRLKASNTVQLQTGTTTHLIVSSSGNVGIGTTSPAANLEIKGSATALQLTTSDYVLGASGSRTIIGFGASTGNTYSRIQTTDAGGVSASDLVLQVDSGNVGIGIAAPVSKLQVAGNGATYGEAITWTGATDYGGANRGYVGYDAAAATTAYIGNEFTGGDAVSARFQIRMGTSPKLTVMSGGNVGIGTNSPSASLHISGASASGLLQIESPTSSNILYVSGSGNVGIGTNTPVSKLTVVSGTDTIYNDGTLKVVGDIALNSANNLNPGLNRWALRARASGSEGAFDIYDARNSVSRLFISGSGNIGIGTTSPSTLLHTLGTTPVRAETTSGNTKAGFEMASAYYGGVGAGTYFYPGGPSIGNNIFGEVANNLMQTNLFQMAAGSMKIGTTGPGDTQLYTNSLPRLTISSSGNIGIGTTSPSYRLHVVGEGYFTTGIITNFTVPIKLIVNGGDINDATEFRTGTGEFKLYSGRYSGSHQSYVFATGDNYTSGTIRMIITGSTGNVGIGTSTPGYKLEVNGGPINIVNGFSDPTAEAGYRLKFADNGGITNDSGIGLSGGLGSESLWINKGAPNGNIRFMFGTLGEKVTFTSTGSVGIGTTTPSASLHISGSSGSVLLEVDSNSTQNILYVSGSGNIGVGTSTPGFKLDVNGSISGTSLNSNFAVVSTRASKADFYGFTGPTLSYYNGVSVVPALTVNSTGNITINTTTDPGAKLAIRGAGSTSATTVFRVENANASSSFTITDDSTSRFYGNVGIGALPASGSLHISGAASTSSAAVYIYKSGSTTLDIQGSQGQLFSVTDALSGSLMSVNDISGLPILEVFSDDRVVMGSFSQPALLVTGSAVRFPATASTAPAYTGSEGQVVFGVVGGNAFIYAWLGGRWRSGSLA